MNKLFLLAGLAVMLVATSCKKKLNEKNLTDTWKMTRISVVGFDLPLDEVGQITMELKNDGSGNYILEGQEETPIDAWSLSDETLSLTMGGQTLNYKVSEYDGEILKIETDLTDALDGMEGILDLLPDLGGGLGGFNLTMIQEFTRQK